MLVHHFDSRHVLRDDIGMVERCDVGAGALFVVIHQTVCSSSLAIRLVRAARWVGRGVAVDGHI